MTGLYCRNLEVMSSNFGWVKLGMSGTSVLEPKSSICCPRGDALQETADVEGATTRVCTVMASASGYCKLMWGHY